MNKKTKPVSTNSTSTGKTGATTPDTAPDALPPVVPDTPPSDTTVAMRMTRKPSDYVPPAGSTDSECKPVVVHDLQGYVVFALPPHLKEVLSEEAFERCVSDFEAHEVIAIYREVDTIVYIRMQCVAQLFAMPKPAQSPEDEAPPKP